MYYGNKELYVTGYGYDYSELYHGTSYYKYVQYRVGWLGYGDAAIIDVTVQYTGTYLYYYMKNGNANCYYYAYASNGYIIRYQYSRVYATASYNMKCYITEYGGTSSSVQHYHNRTAYFTIDTAASTKKVYYFKTDSDTESRLCIKTYTAYARETGGFNYYTCRVFNPTYKNHYYTLYNYRYYGTSGSAYYTWNNDRYYYYRTTASAYRLSYKYTRSYLYK